ncbi:MAG: cyclomaltodextrinase N-terminal domain-containing protein, partial [Pyrinomonadaceae bacterium]
MKNLRIQRCCLLLLIGCGAAFSVAAQTAPEVLKVEPPSWWAGSSVNPIRLLIRGRNLQDARVQAIGRGWRTVAAPKANERGTYLFVDIAIAPNAQPGLRHLRTTTANGTAQASFEILPSLNRAGRFQGFSPADVMYLIMIDRFSDGDTTNNDPLQSRGIYDRQNKFYYHGGDLQGVIDRLPYLKDLGVTAIWLTPWYD